MAMYLAKGTGERMSDEQLESVPSDAPAAVGPPPVPTGPVTSSIVPTVWNVIVPHCPLGRVRIKGETAAQAEAAYRSIAGEDCNPKIPARVEMA